MSWLALAVGLFTGVVQAFGATDPETERRISELLQRMTLEEKLGQMSQSTSMNTPLSAELKEQIARLPERGLTDPIGRLNPEFGTEHNRLFQSFMIGELSADDLKVQYQKALDRAVEDLCETNAKDWTWCAN